jgi:L-fuconolactonase
MRIDAHHHFWKYDPVQYDWIGDEMNAIRRDFLPADLQAEIAATSIDGVVSVQARQTLEETDWLLELASTHDFVKGVAAWLPLAAPEIAAVLERYACREKLVGVRHVVQGEPDGFLAREDFNRGIRALKPFGLIYDILVIERQLPQAIEFVDRHPDQTFVLDHIAKPRIKEGVLEPWRTKIGELAKRENVFCKISGMVTEADFGNWTPEVLRPYFDAVLEAFGARRLMFGSDWPVCLVASEYSRWLETVSQWAAALSSDEKNSLFGDTARRIYHLS